jgi:hypothetical protein
MCACSIVFAALRRAPAPIYDLRPSEIGVAISQCCCRRSRKSAPRMHFLHERNYAIAAQIAEWKPPSLFALASRIRPRWRALTPLPLAFANPRPTAAS